MPERKDKKKKKKQRKSAAEFELSKSERLEQVRHLHLLRWAYLSTQLASVAWFLSVYYSENSPLAQDKQALLVVVGGLIILSVFLTIRSKLTTDLIVHDLMRIGTHRANFGWLEWGFSAGISVVLLLFALVTLF